MILGIAEQSTERCSWCGEPIEPHDCWRLYEQPGARRAAFCRLEHVVPWAMRGPRWDGGEVRVLLVHHRGEHRIEDGFSSLDEMAAWAKSGGRYG
jgi:hypothetical protein